MMLGTNIVWHEIFTFILGATMGFMCAIFYKIADHLSDFIIRFFSKKMEIHLSCSSNVHNSSNFELIVNNNSATPINAWIPITIKVRNKKYPNTWEKLTIYIDNNELKKWSFTTSFVLPCHLNEYESKEVVVNCKIDIPKCNRFKVKCVILNSFNETYTKEAIVNCL